MANTFPRWANWLPFKIVICLAVLGAGVTAGVTYYFTPKYTRVGYMPEQPVPFSHRIHVDQLGLDCRYCHSYVEKSKHSNVPATQTCMGCHQHVKRDSSKLELVRKNWEEGKPIPWVKVHVAPDYVYFDHSVHVSRGVGCVECHGQVNRMEKVYHAKPHSMAWCLGCHRKPEKYLRPLEHIFDLDWTAGSGKDQLAMGRELKEKWRIDPPVADCAGCHR